MNLGLCALIAIVALLIPSAASALVLPPIPEPSSAALFAAGIAVTVIAIRLIRRK